MVTTKKQLSKSAISAATTIFFFLNINLCRKIQTSIKLSHTFLDFKVVLRSLKANKRVNNYSRRLPETSWEQGRFHVNIEDIWYQTMELNTRLAFNKRHLPQEKLNSSFLFIHIKLSSYILR